MAQQVRQIGEGSVDKFEFGAFFAELKQQTEPRGIAAAHRFKLERIKERQRLFDKHLSDPDTFRQYVKAHPLSALIERKIAGEVALHRSDLARVAEEEGVENIESLSSLKGLELSERLLEQYRVLATTSYLDPSYVFSEFPGLAHLCEIKTVSDGFRLINDDPKSEEQLILETEWDTAITYFQKRWRALTREQLTGLPFPPVSRLTRLIAPVPYSGSWTDELYTREPRSMGHLPPLATEGPTETIASPEIADLTTSPSNSGCNIDDIYKLAGASILKQPSTPVDGKDKRYSFPGNLGWGEDIFYDYAVLVPVDHSDIDEPSLASEARSLLGARVTAEFGKTILKFLSDQHLDDALGPQVTGIMYAVLEDIVHIAEGAPANTIRFQRKRLREMAALCRTISRNRMLFSPSTISWDDLFVALDTALNNFPEVHSIGRAEAQNDIAAGQEVTTLQLIDRQLPPERTYSQNWESEPGEFSAPNAVFTTWPMLMRDWMWNYAGDVPTGWLRRYIRYLGGTFQTKLVALRDSARAVRDSLDQIRSSGRTDALAEFARFAEGLVNDALMALARLFDDIAEQLSLPSTLKPEGSKRVAHMVVYRQFWFPEGYVAGKLVGYKNLLPNQKETLRRRTFVKTTREVTTAQEFAASREEDFTHSSKETEELVKEASSDFNFSAKTTGGFDFLIVSGNLDTSTGTDQKDVSKAIHSRVAESTMKASIKYNEKREVKIRELTEIEDVQETITEVQNLNREITANYFYYQLYRQYYVTTEIADIRPVLLRTRDVPDPESIDEKFLSNYAHIFVHALPRQLSADMQEAVGDIELLGRTFIRRRSDWDLTKAMYEQFREAPMPAAAPAPAGGSSMPDQQGQWRVQLESLERAVTDARSSYIEAEENYIRARTRLDRVISHVRENVYYYMQFIWNASPKVDQDKMLQDESFGGQPLGAVTQGFMRLGYYGNDEIFEYAGNSLGCVNKLMDDLVTVSDLSDGELKNHPFFQRLKRYYPSDTDEMIIDRMRAQVFIRDPASPEEINNSRRVQVAQDALVVEALPGQVPLLEAFQMAHRMLDVQKACLENEHLSERIKGRPWERDGQDSYRVLRREGEGGSLNVQIEKDDVERQ